MKELDALFHPKSIALVGVPRSFKVGKLFLMGLQDQGFPGPIYPVNPYTSEIDGLRSYPSLTEVPDPLDMVIVMVSKGQVRDVLEECVRKRVKSVVLYTSALADGNGEGSTHVQDYIRETARRGGFRVLGPNCLGVYSPEAGVAFFPDMPTKAGGVGLVSQSGYLSSLFATVCAERNVFFRHIVSYGNGYDLEISELLEWMGRQEAVRVLCAYCEGVRDGRALAKALDRIAGRKPMVIWKTGNTPSGQRAAASHTGSMSGEQEPWNGIFRQYGVLQARDFEETVDLLMSFYYLPLQGEGRIAIVSGPGGPAVSAADAAERNGLRLACLEDRTTERLRAILQVDGTSCGNPIDVGLGASYELSLYLDTLKALSEDRTVDAILILGGAASNEMNEKYVEGLAAIRTEGGKPILACTLPGFFTDSRLLGPLYDAGIPVYSSLERAVRSYARVMQYARFSARRTRHPS